VSAARSRDAVPTIVNQGDDARIAGGRDPETRQHHAASADCGDLVRLSAPPEELTEQVERLGRAISVLAEYFGRAIRARKLRVQESVS